MRVSIFPKLYTFGFSLLIAALCRFNLYAGFSGPRTPEIAVPAGSSIEVDCNSGAASASYPIFQPLALGPIPPVVLRYHSDFPNGFLGVGWRLEFGYIKRNPKNGVPVPDTCSTSNRGKKHAPFTFLLGDHSGELIFVNKTEAMPCINNGLLKFSFDERNPEFWYGRAPNGTRYTFLKANEGCRWNLSRVEDVNGNFASISYGNNNQPLQLTYGRNDRYPARSPHWFEITFDYERRNDVFFDCSDGFCVTTRHRLSEIKIFYTSGESQRLVRRVKLNYTYSHDTHRSLITRIVESGSDNSTELPAISFQYTTNFASASALKPDCGWRKASNLKLHRGGLFRAIPQLQPGEELSNRSYFVDVNNDGRPDLVRFIFKNPPKESNPSLTNEVFYNLGPIFQLAGLQTMPVTVAGQFADVVGSPAAELLQPYSQNMYVWDNQERKWLVRENPSIPMNWITTADLNRDSHIDYIIGKPKGWNISGPLDMSVHMGGGINSPNVVVEQSQYSLNDIFNGTELLTLQDLNGDGLPELLLQPNIDNELNWVVLHHGSGWGDASVPNGYSENDSGAIQALIAAFYSQTEKQDRPFVFIDINGDHLSDFVYWDSSQLRVYMNTGMGWISEDSYYKGFKPMSNSLLGIGIGALRWSGGDCMADINCDGMVDIINYNDLEHDPDALSFYHFEGELPDLLQLQLIGDQPVTEIDYTSTFEMEDMCFGEVSSTKMVLYKNEMKPWPSGCHAGYTKTVVKSLKVHPGSYGDPPIINEYRYMHGYYDEDDKEFRGFQKIIVSTPSNPDSASHTITTEYYIKDSSSADERKKMRLFQGLPIKRTKIAEDGENTTRSWTYTRTNLYGFHKFPGVDEDIFITILLKSSRDARDPEGKRVIAAAEKYYPTGGRQVPVIHGTSPRTGPNYLTPTLSVTGNAEPYSSRLGDEYPYMEGFSLVPDQELFQVAEDSEAVKTETTYISRAHPWLLGYPEETSFYGRRENSWSLQKMQVKSYDFVIPGVSPKGQLTEVRDYIYRRNSSYKPHQSCDCPDEDYSLVSFSYNKNGTVSKMMTANWKRNRVVYHDINYTYHPETGFHVVQKSEETDEGLRLSLLYSWDPGLGVVTRGVICSNGGSEFTVNSTEQERVDYSYDSFGRLTGQSAYLNNSPVELSRIRYEWISNQPFTRIETMRDSDNSDSIKIFREEYFDNLGRTKIVKGPHPNDAAQVVETSRYRYDDRGRISQSMYPGVDPDRAAWVSFEFDGIGNRRTVTLPNGTTRKASWSIRPDNSGTQRTAVIMEDEAGKRKMHLYDVFGRVVETREFVGENTYRTFYRYDGNGNLIRFEDAEGSVQIMTYDLAGNLLSVSNLHASSLTDPAEYGTRYYCYDKHGNKTRKISPEGRIIDYCYDAIGRIKAVDYKDWRPYDSDADGNVGADPDDEDFQADVRCIYDRYETFPLDQQETPYTIGNLLQIITPQEQIWYEYDQRGRRISETRQQDFEKTLYRTSYTYDRNNALLEINLPSPPSNQRIVELNPPRRWPLEESANESAGLTIRYPHARGISIHFSRMSVADYDTVYVMKRSGDFNNPGNLLHLVAAYSSSKVPFWTQIVDGDTVKVCVKSNGKANKSSIVIDSIQLGQPEALSFTRKVVYDYETTHPTRMRFAKRFSSSRTWNFADVVKEAQYNKRGQLTRLELGNRVMETYDYYEPDQGSPPFKLKKVDIRLFGETRSWQFAYESDGKLSSVTQQGWDPGRMVNKCFVYDELNRLIGTRFESKDRQTENYEYTYSPIGNLTRNGSWHLSYNSPVHPHAVTRRNSLIYIYDKDGNMTDVERPLGQKSLPVRRMEWDPQNRLHRLKRQSMSEYTAFFYGSDGLRIGKALVNPNGNKQLTARYIGNYLEHRFFENAYRNNSYYNLFFNGRLLAQKSEKPIVNQMSYWMYHHQGGTGNIVLTTHDAGIHVSEKEYMPLGEVYSSYPQTTPFDVNYSVGGRELDDESGLVFAGDHYYDPILGQRLSAANRVNSPPVHAIGNPQLTNAFRDGKILRGAAHPFYGLSLTNRWRGSVYRPKTGPMLRLKIPSVRLPVFHQASVMVPVMNYKMSPGYILGSLSAQAATVMQAVNAGRFNIELGDPVGMGADLLLHISEGGTIGSFPKALVAGLPISLAAWGLQVGLEKAFQWLLEQHNTESEGYDDRLKAGYELLHPDGPPALEDLDGDGVPNYKDPDRDGDGVPNDRDNYPDDPQRSIIGKQFPGGPGKPRGPWIQMLPQAFRLPQAAQYPLIRQPFIRQHIQFHLIRKFRHYITYPFIWQ